MAASTGASGWLRGKVKALTSGDCLLIMGSTKAEIPPEKSITLSYLMAPRLARRGGVDEPFAWESREYLRKLCVERLQEVTFRVDYTAPNIGREFGTVYLGDKNVAYLVVAAGWARVKEQGPKGGEPLPNVSELLRLEEVAKQQGLGRWSKEPGAAEDSIRDLPPSAIGELSGFDAKGFAVANKGKSLEAIVEQVRDGSTIRVYLLPSFQFVQIYVAGVQAPSMGRRPPNPTVVAEPEGTTNGTTNGDDSGEAPAPLTTAQSLAASTASTEVPLDRFGREAKHFTETHVLNRDVRIVVEGTDSFSNIIDPGVSACRSKICVITPRHGESISWLTISAADDIESHILNSIAGLLQQSEGSSCGACDACNMAGGGSVIPGVSVSGGGSCMPSAVARHVLDVSGDGSCKGSVPDPGSDQRRVLHGTSAGSNGCASYTPAVLMCQGGSAWMDGWR
ncbi:ribonuclease TUDOR 1 [Aegilops tauschii subsp. strangulata]|uniref:ribonuclease TUDOR 1 n=1 Tax=Aegilops tauschii subsp. strangulata TaxID=200361 RepID=UPI001ABD3313